VVLLCQIAILVVASSTILVFISLQNLFLYIFSYYVKLGQIMILNVLCNELYLTDNGNRMASVVNSCLQECEKKK